MSVVTYRNNPRHLDREGVTLEDIPFVQEEWKIKLVVLVFDVFVYSV